MLQQLINHNEDIKRLIDDGYEVEINGGYIFTHHIPYVKSNLEIAYATLFCAYNKQGLLLSPINHTIYYIGGTPCDEKGKLLKIYSIARILRLQMKLLLIECFQVDLITETIKAFMKNLKPILLFYLASYRSRS